MAPAASWTCVYFTTAALGSTTNTATADSAQTASASDAATVTAAPAPAPAIHVTKSAAPTQLSAGGGTVSYTFLVTNPGNVPLSNVSVTDDTCAPLTSQGGDTNGDNKLDTNETWKYVCTGSVTTTTTDTVSATATYGSTRVNDSAKLTVTVLVSEPALHLEKSASPTSLPVGGGIVTYTYLVTNVGNAPLSNVDVSDDKCASVSYVSGDTNSNSRLDLTETWKFTCSSTLTATTTNHARATGSFNGSSVSDTDQATVTVALSQPAIHIAIAANPTSLPAGGGNVTYTYVVTNPGNTPLSSISLTDDVCTNLQFTGGDGNTNSRLDLGETWSYRCTTAITATTTNTATVTGHAGSASVSDSGQATVAVTASHAAINVVKTASVATLPAGGGSVTYTYVVTNKGNVPLSNISLVDDKCSAVTAAGGDANGNGKLDLGETWTYECKATLTATTTNTALVTGFSGSLPVTDTDTALVTVGTPTQTTPRIGLTLTADPVVLPDMGGNVTYTYVITNKGDVALSNVGVTDDSCSPVGAPQGDTNANGLLDLGETWTATCTAMVTHTTTNTATATGQGDGQTVSAVDTATVTLTPPAPTPTPTEGPTPTPTTPTGAPGSSAEPGTSAAPGTSGAPSSSESPGATPTLVAGVPGATPPTGGSGAPGGAVSGATSGPGNGNGGGGQGQGGPNASQAPGSTAVSIPDPHSPSGEVMAIVLMLGIAAAVLIMTLSKRTTSL
jgi:uncharacterized repeat protein (TIGR01451 family)